jgi:oxygen-independent coproporphyrinogen III oxidase
MVTTMTDWNVPLEVVERYDRPAPRYTSYPTIPVWETDFTDADYHRALETLRAQSQDALSLYIHLPFCAQGCWYCGCNSMVTHKTSVIDEYLHRMYQEIEMVVSRIGHNRRVAQIHLGGGTPNHLSDAQLQSLMEFLDCSFDLAAIEERSIEIDPRIGSPAQLEAIRHLGFTRVSFGVQDFDPNVQAAIGRIQPETQTRELYDAARRLGFEGVNFDLVYGLPAQTAETFERTIRGVIEQGPDRVACFNYAHVPWMRPSQRRIDETLLPTSQEKFHLFQMAVELFTAHGYEWIGLDHFAKQNDELSVAMRERRLHRNFMGYALRPGEHLMAFGMSGIGELAGCYVQNDAKLPGYQKSLDAGRLPVTRGHWMTADDRLRRAAITSLMCNLELPFHLRVPAAEIDVRTIVDERRERLRPYECDDFIVFEADRLRVTPRGRFFIRNICMELDGYLNETGPKPRFSRTV